MKNQFPLLQFQVLLVLSIPVFGFLQAQPAIDSLENRLEQVYGKEKLQVLNQLTGLYLSQNQTKEALKHAQEAEILVENVIQEENISLSSDDYFLKPLTYVLLGRAYRQKGQYLESKEAFKKAHSEARDIDRAELIREARAYLREIDSISLESGKEKKKPFRKIFKNITSTVDKTSSDLGVTATLRIARLHENRGNYTKAIEQYTKAMNQMRDLGKWEEVYELREQIAELYGEQGSYLKAIGGLSQLQQEMEEAGNQTAANRLQKKIEELQIQIETTVQEALDVEIPDASPPTETEKALAKAEEDARGIKRIAEQAESSEDFEKSLYYFKQYAALEQQLAEEKRMQELALLEQAHQIESQDREITLLKKNEDINTLQLAKNQAELKRQMAFKRNLAIGIGLLAIIVFTLYLLYHNKRRDHRKLGLAYHNLEVAKGQLQTAEQKIKNLLEQQVSGAVAHELLAASDAGKVARRFVCIMFLDIRDFTPFAEKLSPEEIIEYQNEVLGFMIETVIHHKGIVNQILGDGFMATFGAPVSAGNDCLEAYTAAREIIERVQEKSESGEIPPTKIGIGLHAGHVVAGNVGTEDRKQYSITGNTVIIAARLEQLNKKFGSSLVVSKEVYDQLPESIKEPAEFNPVKVKGRSEPVEVAVF